MQLQAALLTGEAPGGGISLDASDLRMGSPSLELAGTGLDSLGAGGLGGGGGGFGGVGGNGFAMPGHAGAPGGSATAGAVRVDDAAGGNDTLMPDDPWEQLFGPAAWPL